MAAGYKWKRLQRAKPLPATEAVVAAWMTEMKIDRAEALRRIADNQAKIAIWRNDLYQVQVYPDEINGTVHLCIRRIDGWPGRDWRHFQQIKNELVGAECEAIELYPAESRLTDTSNKYHLYASTDPTFRFPFGYATRDVQFGDDTEGGLRQRSPMQFAKDGGSS